MKIKNLIQKHKKRKKDFMGIVNTKKDALVIIGNGFDLQHEYKTKYNDFVEHTSCKAFDSFKIYTNNYLYNNKNWYDFEQVIKDLTLRVYLNDSSIKSDHDLKIHQNILDEIINSITQELCRYLKNETSKNNGIFLPNVQNYLNDSSVVLNFNYTPVAERYTKNIFYVHGSVMENNIILGYDNRNEPCLIDYTSMQRRKSYLRLSLEFCRFLKAKNIDSNQIEIYKQSFNSFLDHLTSPKGLDHKDYINTLGGNLINEFYLKNDCFNKIIIGYDIDYNSIEKIVILGHGIEADIELLDSILKQCTKLKEIIIFRYEKESDTKYKSKENFFHRYSPVRSQRWK